MMMMIFVDKFGCFPDHICRSTMIPSTQFSDSSINLVGFVRLNPLTPTVATWAQL